MLPVPQGQERNGPALSGSSLFVSDLHLSPRRPETAALFLDFLAGPARETSALFILGDLFDYWPGDDGLNEPFSRHICDALADTVAAGVDGFFLPGNRDFLAGPAFAAATGLRFLDDTTVCDVAGEPTLLLHGDTLCTDDKAYQDFRATVRADAWRREFLSRPLDERRRDIEALRERSESEKQAKAYELMDASPDAVSEAFRHSGVARMIHGHTHRQARHDLVVDGRECQRWVLGQWEESGNALVCEGSDWRWLAVPR